MIARARRFPLFALPLVLAACGGSNDELPAAPSKLTPLPPPAPTVAKGPEKPAYPKAPKKTATDTYAWQGDSASAKVNDDYRGLEDAKDPAVVAWSDAENAMTRKLLDADPQRSKIATRVGALMGEASPQWNDVVARKGVVFALERRPPKQQPYLVVMTSLAGVDKERVLVDPNVLDATGGTSIGWFVPSPDGKKI
ncbi:MAG TPA: S9 family peptidase, partial [Polyangiaceae bacterium]